MKPHSQRGIALIVTLLMLSVVTFMAVFFLAVSQREKASVNLIAELKNADLMANAALSRAEAEVTSRMLATTNPYNYGFMVSTNFINPAGFETRKLSLTNVNYRYPNGGLLSDDDRLYNLANLLYDPRPPVFVPTNSAGATDFRFYLDFNRNGVFDSNGILPVLSFNGMFYTTNGNLVSQMSQDVLKEHYVGDPEWIGVLENPNLPHSESNQFVGRYAYIVLPVGKSLDLNYIHNYNKATVGGVNMQADGFYRNEGVGSWEINLAAFLADLNTNIWPVGNVPGGYHYDLRPTAANAGFAFQDALSILRYRLFNNIQNLASVNQLFGASGDFAFRNDGIDGYGDDDLTLALKPYDSDVTAKPWPGSEQPRSYIDFQETFDSNKTSIPFVGRLYRAMTNSISSYDRYTYYRLISQLGTDSVPALSNRLYQSDIQLHPIRKMHLNYRTDVSVNNGRYDLLSVQVPNGQTNFVTWSPTDPDFGDRNPLDFFYQAADRIIRSQLQPRQGSNAFELAGTPVGANISVTNIQLYPYSEYTAELHRCLQLAANIYDAKYQRHLNTTNDYPSVFKPLVEYTSVPPIETVRIIGFTEVTNATAAVNTNWWRLEEPGERSQIRPGDVVFGLPWVIGAKKGYPAFNELHADTVTQITRKLQVEKPALGARPSSTNQMYLLSISNVFGIEGWNSYELAYNRPFELRVTNVNRLTLSHRLEPDTNYYPLISRTFLLSNNIVTNFWPGRGALKTTAAPGSFMIPIYTNTVLFTNAIYSSFPPHLFTASSNVFERSFNIPHFRMNLEVRLQYIMIDRERNRIIDFVNLGPAFASLGSGLDPGSATGSSIFGDKNLTGSLSENDFWITNRVGGLNSPSIGLTNQLAVSAGVFPVGDDVWRAYNADAVAAGDKDKAIAAFREFFRPGSTNRNLAMQAPFSPTRKGYKRISWQVNDPFVRFTEEDVRGISKWVVNEDPAFGILRPPSIPLPENNLGRINDHYRPWGIVGERTPEYPRDYDLSMRDPLVESSDDWRFPTNAFPSIGLLGRVHRGTPWQTIYLKSEMADPREWRRWAGAEGTHPTNDWRLLDLFTVAANDNAARGLLSVNQTNVASWSAVLSGVMVRSNTVANPRPGSVPQFEELPIQPGSRELYQLAGGLYRTRESRPLGSFTYMGEVLATPELTVNSPFLGLPQGNTAVDQARLQRMRQYGISDEMYEWIPQQILSLLKEDDLRFVVYAFGQSLKPAERSVVTSGVFYNMCTNYVVTGEVVKKAFVRIENAPQKPRVRIEKFSEVAPE